MADTYRDAQDEIATLRQELEQARADLRRVRAPVCRLLDLYDSGNVLGTIAAIPGLREALDGGT